VFVARVLRRSPGFSAGIILPLAIGYPQTNPRRTLHAGCSASSFKIRFALCWGNGPRNIEVLVGAIVDKLRTKSG